jgi:PAS domain S-box-containing protein
MADDVARDGEPDRAQGETREHLRAALERLRGEVARRAKVEEALRESEERLRLLLDSTAEGIYGVDLDGNCTFCNPASLSMLGYADPSQFLGRSLHRLVHHSRPDGSAYPEEECPTHRTLREGKPAHSSFEVFWRADGTKFVADARSYPIYRGGKLAGCVVTFLDVSERQRADEALRKLSRAVEQAADSIIITDRTGVIEYVNPAYEKLTGFSASETLGRRPRLLRRGVHDSAPHDRLWACLLSGQVFRQIFPNQRKDGARFYEDQTISPIADAAGVITHFVWVGRDISRRIEAEEQLIASREQLRRLAARLESVREEERTRISREIHDELGQILTVLKIDLCRLPTSAGSGSLQEKIGAMTALVDSTIDLVGRIAAELRPPALDNLGLVTALEGLAREFQARTGVRCEVVAEVEELELPSDVATTVFRICQEALTNVARHAEARSVVITIQRSGSGLVLTVEDDGKGIREEQISASNSLGLLGMQERAFKHGGKVLVSGAPEQGTVVTLAVPLATRPAGTEDG